jgi:hypothetical protein
MTNYSSSNIALIYGYPLPSIDRYENSKSTWDYIAKYITIGNVAILIIVEISVALKTFCGSVWNWIAYIVVFAAVGVAAMLIMIYLVMRSKGIDRTIRAVINGGRSITDKDILSFLQSMALTIILANCRQELA